MKKFLDSLDHNNKPLTTRLLDKNSLSSRSSSLQGLNNYMTTANSNNNNNNNNNNSNFSVRSIDNNESLIKSFNKKKPFFKNGSKNYLKNKQESVENDADQVKIYKIKSSDSNKSLFSFDCCGFGFLGLIWTTKQSNEVSSNNDLVIPNKNPYHLDTNEWKTTEVAGSNEQLTPKRVASTSAGQSQIFNNDSHSQQIHQQSSLCTDDPETSEMKLGRIQFSISYDFPEQTLTLRIIRATDLVAKDFSGTSDPYVKIMLLPDKKRKLTTNVKRKNLNPRWNEVFAFEGFPYNKLMNKNLYLQVLDYDRFSKDDPIGEICIPLTDFDLTSGQTFWKNLQPCKSHMGKLGEVQIGLCYHPSNGQLTVKVIRARDLKAKDINGLSDPYVKIWLMQEGKKAEKKKTKILEKTLNPTFDEQFAFEVPYEKIRQTSLMISVMDYDRMGRNEQIGQVLLGSKSGPMEMRHWNEMFSKSRQEVFQWHILKDFG